MRTVTEVQAEIKVATANAFRGCGLSDVLFESRLQQALAGILAQASDEDRPVVEAVLLESGFDPHFEPFEAEPGQCSLTGIEVDCCPCGRHE